MKQKRWLIPAIVAAIIVIAAGASYLLSRPTAAMLTASVQVEPTERTELGLAADSSFTITTGWRVSRDELRAMLDIEPDIGDYTIGGSGRSWTLHPGAPLADNTVYTIRVVDPETGEAAQSFAFQTKSDLAVHSAYPRDGAIGVPLETGIELGFNAPGVDLKDHFEIKPETAGSFETKDYTAIFRPDAPLAPDSIYRVTLKAGLRAPNGMTLKEDYAFSFETTGEGEDGDFISLEGDFAETFLPGDPLVLEFSASDDVSGEPFDVTLHRYADISGFIKEQRGYDAFYAERYGRKTDYVVNTAGLEEAASFTAELVPLDAGADYHDEFFLPLPEDLAEGCYVVTISGGDWEGSEQKLLQISSLNVYAQSSDGDTLLWLNDAATGGAVGGAMLELEDTEKAASRTAETLADGTARLMTGEMETGYLTVMRDARTVFFEKLELSAREDPPLSEKYYAALYTDREIYKPDDTIRFWGVVRPRAGGTPPQAVWATLGQYGPEGEVCRVKAAVGSDGTFTGSMKLTGIRKSWYEFTVTDGDGGDYTSKGLTVEDYQKPAYVITVTTDREYYYADEPVAFEISASYFDGTPLSGGRLTFSGSYMGNSADGMEQTPITLDAAGRAVHTTRINTAQLWGSGEEALSWTPRRLWYTVDNSDTGDGGYFSTQGTVTVLPSRIAAKTTRDEAGGDVTVQTAALDPSGLSEGAAPRPLARMIYPDEYDSLAGAPADLPVTLIIHETTYTEVPTGSYYDNINKRTAYHYRYDRGERVAATLQGRTSGGRAVFTGLSDYLDTENTYYSFETRFDGRVAGLTSDHLANYGSPYPYRGGRASYTFRDDIPDGESGVELGEQVTLSLYQDGVKAENGGRILYSVLQRQALETGVTTEDTITFTMKEQYLPEIYYAGAYFDGRHVYPIEPHSVRYDYSGRELSLTVTTDKEAYRPGDTAAVTLKALDKEGNPVSGSAVVGVVDEAVFSLREQDVDLAGQLYQNIFYPYLRQEVSCRSYGGVGEKAIPNTAGGMDADGGAETYIREDFVDTAGFRTVALGADGTAALTLELPDNVTSWRITALAVTADLLAGDTVSKAAATLPFYLNTVVTGSYLVGDDLSMSVSAAGTGISPDDPVDYTVTVYDARGVRVDELSGKGRAVDHTPFNFGKYDAGGYTVRFTAACGEYADVMETPFSVVKEGLTVPVIENMPLVDVNAIDAARWPVRLTVYDARMKPYMDGLQVLTRQSGGRTELLAADYRARLAANELLDPEDRATIRKDDRLEELQDDHGGVRPLPLAEGDAAVTAKLLVAAPELVGKADALGFLREVLKDSAATPDDRVMAYLGLAASGEPVLLDISRMLEQEGDTLTVSQKLYLGAALAQLGDFTGADAIYEALGDRLVSDGQVKYVEAGGSLDDRVQNTAAALMLTSVASHPDADALMRFLNGLDTDRARPEALCNLEQLCYIEHFKLPAGESAARFGYTSGGQRQELALERGSKSLTLSAEALAEADFSGGKELYACVSYTTHAREVETAGGKATITKTYTPVTGDGLSAAGRARVELTVTFAPDAPDGCYTVTDQIPAGMRFMPFDIYQPHWEWLWGQMENESQTVTGCIYRRRSVWEKLQAEKAAAAEEAAEEDEAAIPGSDPAVGEDDPNTYTLTYYVSMPLSGRFVSESAYVTPQAGGAAAKSERGTIEIK